MIQKNHRLHVVGILCRSRILYICSKVYIKVALKGAEGWRWRALAAQPALPYCMQTTNLTMAKCPRPESLGEIQPHSSKAKIDHTMSSQIDETVYSQVNMPVPDNALQPLTTYWTRMSRTDCLNSQNSRAVSSRLRVTTTSTPGAAQTLFTRSPLYCYRSSSKTTNTLKGIENLWS